MNQKHQKLLENFEQKDMGNCNFGHKQHVIGAYLLLQKYDFITAAYHYASSIQIIAKNAGMEHKYNTTITLSLLSLISERMESSNDHDIDTFITNNPDLIKKNPLKKYFTQTRISSDMAKRILLLPDRIKNT